MKYKMVVCDFDGTLYRDDYTISEKNVKAVNDYVSAGGKFVIATGRLFKGIRPQAQSMNLHGEVIAYQGGGIYDIDTGEEMFSSAIDNAAAVELLTFLNEEIGDKKCLSMVYYNDDCYSRKRSMYLSIFAKIVKIKVKYTKVKLQDFVAEGRKEPHKILAMAEKNYIDELAGEIRKRFSDKITVTKSSPVLLEMVMPNSSKATAIDWLANKYGIGTDEIIAIGDSENDISMIKHVGLGVAVGNAMDNVRKAADYIAPDNDDDGVAYVLEKFCLAGESE